MMPERDLLRHLSVLPSNQRRLVQWDVQLENFRFPRGHSWHGAAIMGEWDFLGGLFDNLQAHSPMLGRFWLLLMLVFRILILGTVASDLFEDEQEEFICNTLQPGCRQGCYDMAFPISQYRFWVFHIVLIATPSMLFIMYAMHHHTKKKSTIPLQVFREARRLRSLYIINVAFRFIAEVGFLVGQWWLYGFKVEPQILCSRAPCPFIVDCYTSRPAEKTIFLCFYFAVGVLSAFCSFIELFYGSIKWFCCNREPLEPESKEKTEMSSSGRQKQGLLRGGSSRKAPSVRSSKHRSTSSRTQIVWHRLKHAALFEFKTLDVYF